MARNILQPFLISSSPFFFPSLPASLENPEPLPRGSLNRARKIQIRRKLVLREVGRLRQGHRRLLGPNPVFLLGHHDLQDERPLPQRCEEIKPLRTGSLDGRENRLCEGRACLENSKKINVKKRVWTMTFFPGETNVTDDRYIQFSVVNIYELCLRLALWLKMQSPGFHFLRLRFSAWFFKQKGSAGDIC